MGRRALEVAPPVIAAIAVIALAACPKPTDGTPQIAVSPNAAGRLNLIPSRAPGKKAQASANARARAHPMRAGEELGGPNATGRVGDWVLENDEVVFVIDGLGGGGGFAESGGNLVDAADARARKDELGLVFTYFGTFPRQGVYGSIDAREEPDGAAVVVVKGKELYDPSILVTTEYRLAGADRALLIETTLENTGASAITLPAVGDAIQWGAAEKVAPGKAVGFKGRSEGPFIGGVGRFVSYAITTPEGEIAAISGGAWTDTEQTKNVSVAPRASVKYQRVFAVGERADVASIVTELTKASGGDVGAIEIAIVDEKGASVTVPAGAKVIVANDKGDEVMNIVAAKEGDTIAGEIPPGKWQIAYAPSAGRRSATGSRVPVEVKSDAVSKAKVAVTDVAAITVGCTEKSAGVLPCKVSFEGVSGTTTPDFGPAHVATAARNQIFAVTEKSTVAIAPGKYRLTFSRGPEYAPETMDVTLAPGTGREAVASLARVVDTTGYVATDFHQHTILSADAAVGTRDRVLANTVEAVEVAVVSEHNLVGDLAPIVRELGVGKWVVHVPGDEVSTDASRKPWGHVNVFPLEPDPSKPRNGAFPVRDRLAKEVIAEARALGGSRVVQVNHPRSGSNGYFDLLGFDPKTGTGTGAGYTADFDAIEVWNGRNVEARGKVLEDFLALLRTSHPVTPIADTDTHGVVGQEAGMPRTYVRVGKDDALDAWDAARTGDLVKAVRSTRDVVLTNGPFLKVSANGAGIGGVARGREIQVKVGITSAPFVVVDKAEVRLAGSGKVVTASPVTLTPTKSAAGVMTAEASFSIRASADDAFVVIVSGTRAMKPMYGGDDREISPWAMSGAIWIDADGDGKSLGREAPRR
ncbi:MAG: CehA/McbA family metallohydrolase [Labilithrix sp.]|nr:CehA/McbA family metallohydrolase [Labilithrix sp.]